MSLLMLILLLPDITTAQTYKFTNAGATGRTGPTQTQLNSAYSGTNLQGAVTSKSGIQEWIVPASGPYKIKVAGAQGAPASSTTGGRGAIMEGEFFLTAGDTLHILVGQKGEYASARQYLSSPGGGGSFVMYPNKTPLIIAGGGGGTGNQRPSDADASTGTGGNNSSTANTGGSNGNGGTSGITTAGAGGGLLTNGTASGAAGGNAYVNGGLGGIVNATYAPQGGGFGGGGSVTAGANSRYGGGGGYSGGGGSASLAGATTGLWGGGGGSYNAGLKQNNLAGANYDEGYVIIEPATRTGNNAGVISIDSPTVFCGGPPQRIVATIANLGVNQISSVKVNWSAGGVLQTPVTYSSTLDTAGGSGASSVQIFLGNYTFGGKKRVIKVWTSDPNGVTDTTPGNDTASAIIGPSMNGVYTIGGLGADYAKINDALTDMMTIGICDSVRFVIAPGTYSERVEIQEIPGASATNTITFEGTDKSTTIITNNGTSTSNWQTVFLDGADHIVFRNLTIRGTGSYGIGIHLTNGADHNTFRNLNVEVNATSTSTNVEGIVGSGSATVYSTTGTPGEYNTFDNINVTGGYYGVYYTGIGTTSTIEGSTFNAITVNDHYYYGINVQYLNNPVITNNRVSMARNSASYGMRVYYCAGPVVMNNEAHGVTYGIYFYGNNYQVYKNVRGKFINNIFTNTSTSVTMYGYYSRYIDYHHNTIVGTGSYVFSGQNGLDLDIRNNIIVSLSSTSTYEVIGLVGATILNDNLDHNIYYAPNGAGIADMGSVYTTLSDWQSALPQYNKNSLEQDPGLISNSNPRLNNLSIKPTGADLGVLYDIDGDQRCDFAPTIGADESLLGKTGSVTAAIFPPDTVFVNSPALFEGRYVQGTLQKNLWFLDGVLVKDSLDVELLFSSAGQHDLKLVSRTCGNTDTISYTFNVVNPMAAPIADFIIDRNVIAEGDVANFRSLATGGPATFKWTVTPDIYYDDNGTPQPTYEIVGESDTSAFPTLRFDRRGIYSVCLTVSNFFGSDQVCQTASIEVLPRVNLGSTLVIREQKGYLHDDGGQNGNYTDNQLRGVLINACASEVFLTFTKFNLECDYDFVRVYDGVDNTGIPLFSCIQGFTGPGCSAACVPSINDTLVAKSGQMYIEMQTDAGVTAPGFEAYWHVTPANIPPPVADFVIADSVCRGNLVTFVDNSQGSDLQFFWDLDDDLTVFESQDSVSAQWAYFTAGQAKATLIVRNCAGIDTVTKTFIVYDPQSPVADFTANNYRPTATDIVTLSPNVVQCVEKYVWRFSYAHGDGTFQYVSGTDSSSAMPQVIFSDTGCWHAELFVSNITGSDQLLKQCFIQVKEPYCIPTVGTLISDIGISYVRFNNIINQSAQATSAYTNYVSTQKTDIEIGVTYDLELRRNSNVNNISWAAWIDWNQDGDFDDVLENVALEANSSAKTYTAQVTVPIIAKEGPSVLRVGVARGNGSNTVCGQNQYGEYEDYRVRIFQDKTSPVITLTGSADTTVEQGSTYADPGATAIDNLAGNISNRITADTFILSTGQKVNDLNTYVIRDYIIRYRVVDDAGNVGTAERIVRILGDTSAPVLQIELPEVVLISVDVASGTYQTPDVLHAEDNIDGVFTGNVMKVSSFDPGDVDVVQVIDPVDPAVVDTYTVTYYAVDQEGNVAMETRTVIIYDDQDPTLSLVGDATVQHQIGTPYTDAGVSINDNYYDEPTLRSLLKENSNVDVNKFGTYQYTYSLTDPSGNGPVSVVRTVIITDTIAPVITLIGPSSMTIPVNEQFIDPGVTVFDNYGLDVTWIAGGDFYTNFPDAIPTRIGIFTITYSIEDMAGNVSTVDRTVTVVDEIAPVISLVGEHSVNHCRWEAYTDAGYTLSDNYDDSVEITVIEEGSWTTSDITLPGAYSLRYKATDSSGNISYSETRMINVLNPSDPRCATGVEDLEDLRKLIVIYPNPNQGIFTVKAELGGKQVHMSIVNMTGQEVARMTEGMLNEGIFTVDLSGQAAGIYLLKVTSGDNSFTKQIVVTK